MRLALIPALILSIAITFLAGSGTSLTAGDLAAGKLRIDHAGRQRMLTQRMTKSSCLYLNGIDAEAQENSARQASALFEETLSALRNGDPERGWQPEEDTHILELLDTLETETRSLTRSVQQVAAQDTHSVVVKLIAERNVPILKLMNSAVGEVQRVYGAKDVPADVAKTINVAGRQRMLSQKMVKDACFLFTGQNVDVARADLKAAIALFDSSLQMLLEGDEGAQIVKPGRAVRAKHQEVAAIWAKIAPTLRAAAASGGMDLQVLTSLAVEGDALLAAANSAVKAY